MREISRRKFISHAALGSLGALFHSSVEFINSQPSLGLVNPLDEASHILQRIHPPIFPQRLFSITDYGAKPDQETDCRPAILQAISQCSASGGGHVLIPAGNWRVDGALHLESNVDLHLDNHATLNFNPDPNLYLPVVLTRWEGIELYNYSPLIYANNVSNVAITGKGTLIGNAKQGFASWIGKQTRAQAKLRRLGRKGVPVKDRIFGAGHWLRPSMIQFLNCKNVLIDGPTILDSPFWVVHPVYSQNVIVRNVQIDSHHLNNDGVDPDSSVDVLIENCSFNTDDDSISIKSGRDQDGRRVGRPSKNILIRNCSINSKQGGLCIGSEMSGGVRNVLMENCKLGEARSAIHFKSNQDRGGIVERIRVRDVVIDRAGTCVNITCYYPGEHQDFYPPSFRNLVIENIACNAAVDGIHAWGLIGAPLKDVILRNVTIKHAENAYEVRNIEGFNLHNVLINDQPVSLGSNQIQQV